MKVLYIGYYKEKSDWGKQTVNNILALERAGVDVVCRSIELGSKETPRELLHLEKKDDNGATHCIQHVFPEHMIGTNKFEKNVGILANNYIEMKHSSWMDRLGLMDEIWVPSIKHSLPEPLDKITKTVRFAIDTDVFNRRYNDIQVKEIDNDFKFYTFISANPDSISNGQGLSWLLSSFHSEFDGTEPVSLVIYLKTSTEDGQRELKLVEDVSLKIKSDLRIRTSPQMYRKDAIICDTALINRDIREIHQYCDCYVSTNTDFTFPLSEIEADGFGNNPIVADKNSIVDYIGCENAVECSYQVLLRGETGMFNDTNNGHDYWLKLDERDLKSQMRKAFERSKSTVLNQGKINSKVAALKRLNKFSLENAGKRMKEALDV